MLNMCDWQSLAHKVGKELLLCFSFVEAYLPTLFLVHLQPGSRTKEVGHFKILDLQLHLCFLQIKCVRLKRTSQHWPCALDFVVVTRLSQGWTIHRFIANYYVGPSVCFGSNSERQKNPHLWHHEFLIYARNRFRVHGFSDTVYNASKGWLRRRRIRSCPNYLIVYWIVNYFKIKII